MWSTGGWPWLAAGCWRPWLAGPVLAQTDDLPSEPMLRIDAQGHNGEVRAIATDAKERFAVTASEDKTVRVWSLPDGKLQRTIWLPSGNGEVGKAYAVALSPDGATIAAGGWTGEWPATTTSICSTAPPVHWRSSCLACPTLSCTWLFLRTADVSPPRLQARTASVFSTWQWVSTSAERHRLRRR